MALIINFLLTREKEKFKPAPQEVQPPQEMQQESTFPSIVPLSHPDSGNAPAITIVKKPSPKNITFPLPQAAEIEKAPENSNQETPKIFGASGQKSGDETSLDTSTNTSAPVSGITKTNKYPTEIEKREMKSRNIVMY